MNVGRRFEWGSYYSLTSSRTSSGLRFTVYIDSRVSRRGSGRCGKKVRRAVGVLTVSLVLRHCGLSQRLYS